MDDHVFRIQIPCRFWRRRLLFLIGIISSVVLVFHTFTLPYWSVSLPVLLPSLKKEEILSDEATSLERKSLGLFSLSSDTQNFTYPNVIHKELESAEINNTSGRTATDFIDEQVVVGSKREVLLANTTDLVEDRGLNRKISLGFEETENFKDIGDQVSLSVTEEEIVDEEDTASTGVAKAGIDFAFTLQNSTDLFSERNKAFHDETIAPRRSPSSSTNGSMNEALPENPSRSVATPSELVISSSLGGDDANSYSTELRMKAVGFTNRTQFQISSTFSAFDSKNVSIHIRKTKPGRLPVSVSEMRQLMLAYHSSTHQKVCLS